MVATGRYTGRGVEFPLRNRDGETVAWTLVDVDEAEWVGRYRWTRTEAGYAYRRGSRDENGKRAALFLHREILGLESGDGLQADHLNGNRLDNRRENLRAVTPTQNRQNLAGARGTSRFRGVYYYSRDGIWAATVTHNGRTHYCGRFELEEDAAAAAAAKRAELFTHANEAREGGWPHVPAGSDAAAYDRLTDAFLTEDAEWAWPTRDRLDHLRKTSRPDNPRREEPGTT